MRKWYPVALVVLTIVISAIAYPRLPDQVPSHWSLHGQPNAYWSKTTATLAGPVALIVTWIVTRVLPMIDPRRTNYARMGGTYDFVVNAALTLIAALQVIAIAYALNAPIDVARVMPAMLGGMLIVVGNVLPRARPNWWFGVRTPWTLSNDRVWERTNRYAGYLTVAAGVVVLGVALSGLHVPTRLTMAAAIVCSLSVVVFSYAAWSQERAK